MPLPDYIGNEDLARALSGKPDEDDVTPDELIEGLKYGHQQLILWTGKKLWTGNEDTIDQAARIEEHFCASWVKSWWRDPENKSQELFNRGKAMCVAIQENQQMVGDQAPDRVSHVSTTCAIGRSTNVNDNTVPRYTSPRVDY